MNVEKALEAAETAEPNWSSFTLAKEVKRLRKQREQLAAQIPFFKEVPEETLIILDEVDTERQEGKKMTVDQAISYLSRYYSTATAILANEIKRLREFDNERGSIIGEKNEEIERLESIIRKLNGDLCRIHEFSSPLRNLHDI